MSAPDRDPAVEMWRETIQAVAYPTRFVIAFEPGRDSLLRSGFDTGPVTDS